MDVIDIKEYLDVFKTKYFNNLKGLKEQNYNNAKADAIFAYHNINKFLDKDKKILEVGGGIHLLTNFLHQNYDITSIEPGGFTEATNDLRNQILLQNRLNVHTTTLENFKSNKKFDFIFSINVLEHTKDIEQHILSCINLLKDKNSLLFIQCPNYIFPFEPHFYKWFIPFCPNLTFKFLRKKNLIKVHSKKNYENILKNLNFKCTYLHVKKMNLNVKFAHPISSIFDRLDTDNVFRDRLFKNIIVKISYKIINYLKIKNLITYIFPKLFCPYLILYIKK